jgi:uncharacterized protein YbjT (DUF2867 family)
MILLTGATGTVGAATARALQASGAPFKVGARSPDRAKALGVDAVDFDWDRLDTYLPAFRGAERVFLLTPGSERAYGYVMQAVAAAKRAGVKHLVKLSVIGAEMEPGILFGRAHRAAERELEESGLAYTFLRPTFFMQNFVTYYGVDPGRDGPVHLAHGDGKASWIDARDIGEAAAAVLTGSGHEGRAYDLTGGEALSSAEALALLGEALGRNYAYTPVPAPAAQQAMESMGMPLWLVDGSMELDALIRDGHAAGVADGVRRTLGRAPRTFREYARDLAAPKR